MEELNAQVEKLRMANRVNRGLAVADALFCVAAFLLLVRGQIPYALILVAASLMIFLMSRGLNRRYAQDAAAANLRYGLARGLEEFSYQPSGGITGNDFRNWGLLPLASGEKRLLCRHFFSGREGRLKLAGGEVTFHYKASQGGTAGYRFLSGTLFTAQGPQGSGAGDWLLFSEELGREPEIQSFLEEKGYQVLSHRLPGRVLCAPSEAPVPEGLASRLAELPGSVTALRLTSDGAAAYLDGRFYTGRGYPAARPTPERLCENTLPERDGLWNLFRWWLSEDR